MRCGWVDRVWLWRLVCVLGCYLVDGWMVVVVVSVSESVSVGTRIQLPYVRVSSIVVL